MLEFVCTSQKDPRQTCPRSRPESVDKFLATVAYLRFAASPALGCVRSYATPCIRCPLLRPDPAQRDRLIEVRDNLLDRIAEARREGWLGEVEGLKISLTAARNKLAQLEELANRPAAVQLGMPATDPPPDPNIGRQSVGRAPELHDHS